MLNPSVSHKRVWALALPVMLANLTQPILGLVDTAVAGHIGGSGPLGAVALGGLFFSFVFWSFGFLRMATTGLIAQAHGAALRPHTPSTDGQTAPPPRDGAEVSDATSTLHLILLRGLLLAALLGIAIGLLQKPLLHYGLHALGVDHAGIAVRDDALAYCRARIVAAPFALLNYVVLGYLLGLQRMRVALLFQGIVNAVNLAAVWLAVYVLHAGVAGIGAATAGADAVGFVCAFGIVRPAIRSGLRPFRRTAVRPGNDNPPPVASAPSSRVFHWPAWHRMFGLNRDIFGRTLCLQLAFAWFAHAGAQQGPVILAANAVLLNFQTFMAYALDGFAQAAEALVGAAVGARQRATFVRCVIVSSLWALVTALLFGLIYHLTGVPIIDGLTNDPEVRSAAYRYLPWVDVLPVASVLGFVLDGVFIGATRTRPMLGSMALSLLLFTLACWIAYPRYGNHGLWAALIIFLAARGLTLAMCLPTLAAAIERPHARSASRTRRGPI
jgi:MATE family multidrug resistance protein